MEEPRAQYSGIDRLSGERASGVAGCRVNVYIYHTNTIETYLAWSEIDRWALSDNEITLQWLVSATLASPSGRVVLASRVLFFLQHNTKERFQWNHCSLAHTARCLVEQQQQSCSPRRDRLCVSKHGRVMLSSSPAEHNIGIIESRSMLSINSTVCCTITGNSLNTKDPQLWPWYRYQYTAIRQRYKLSYK